MDFVWLVDDEAVFSDDGDNPKFLHLPGEVWDDMGTPTQITVTIEPGDRLN